MTETGPSDWSEDLDGPAIVVLPGSDDPRREFRLGTREYDWHSHARGQLFCVESGLVHVRTERGSWLLPPHRAGWIPPRVPHHIGVSGVLGGWTVLITPDRAAVLPDSPGVVGVTELMRALVRRAISWSPQPNPEQDRQADVLMDEIRQARPERLCLPMPMDPRLRVIARAILDQPGERRTLEEWAKWGGISPRTLRRAILRETGLGFARWRQQARLVHAMGLLSSGLPVAAVSDALGYETPSGFSAMFGRNFGLSPSLTVS